MNPCQAFIGSYSVNHGITRVEESTVAQFSTAQSKTSAPNRWFDIVSKVKAAQCILPADHNEDSEVEHPNGWQRTIAT